MEPVSVARPNRGKGGERGPGTVFAVPRSPSLARRAAPAAPFRAQTPYWLACASRYRTLRNACSIA